MEIKDVLKMKLGKNETLVIKYDVDVITEDELEYSSALLKEMFPKNKILFMPNEMDIFIVSKND